MTVQNRRYEHQRQVEQARARKVARLYDALLLGCHGAVPDAETLRALDDAGWKALEALAGTRPASAETRAALIARVEHAKSVLAREPVDPFDGFAGN